MILYTSTCATEVGLEAIQSLGGNGYTHDYPVNRIMRDAKLYEIGAGTNEIRRWLIGRELIKNGAPSNWEWKTNKLITNLSINICVLIIFNLI